MGADGIGSPWRGSAAETIAAVATIGVVDQLPTGHLFELYADKKHVGNGLGQTNPAPWGPDADRGAAAQKVSSARA